MKRPNWYRHAVVALACVGTVVPHSAFAAAPAIGQPTVRDLALGDGGTLSGQVVDTAGQPQAGSAVTVWHNETQVAATKADSNGTFHVAGLRSGVHQVAAGQGVQMYRFWAPDTAPPAASAEAMVVADQNVARGNNGGGFVKFVTNPWVLAGVVAAAIAIPIALNNDDDKSGS